MRMGLADRAETESTYTELPATPTPLQRGGLDIRNPPKGVDLTQEVTAHEQAAELACATGLVAVYLNTQGWELGGT